MSMNRRFCWAAVGVMMLAGAGWAAGPDMSAWTHVAPVELAERPAKGLVEVPVPPEVMALAQPELGDLRVLTKAGEAVPFVVRVDQAFAVNALSAPGTPPARLFNPLFVPGKQSTVEVDFGTREPRTRIDVDTPGTNFRRRVSVEASQDATAWEVLKKTDWLFRISYEKGSYNKSEVLLPDNDFRYLRITVFNAPDDPEQVVIRNVTARHIAVTEPQTAEVPTKSLDVREDAKMKTTEIEADLGYENLPLHEVTLAFEDANYLRRVEVLGRNVRWRTIVEPVDNSQPRMREVEEPWGVLASGSVYQMPAGEGLEATTGLTLPVNGRCRYVLVRIFNADDAPLKFNGLKVRRLQGYVAFRAEPAGPYQMYFGNAAAARPQYDLENYAGRLRSEGVTVAALGVVAANPLFALPTKVVPWSERHAALLWVGLAVVLGVLTALVLRQARQAKAVGDDEGKVP